MSESPAGVPDGKPAVAYESDTKVDAKKANNRLRVGAFAILVGAGILVADMVFSPSVEAVTAWITAGATTVMAAFAIALWHSTDKLWKTGERDFFATHRPHLGIRPRLESADIFRNGYEWSIKVEITYQIVNVGDSEATVLGIWERFAAYWNEERMGYFPDGEFHAPKNTATIQAGDRSNEAYAGSQAFPVERQGGRERTMPPDEIIFYGIVTYTDALRRKHERGFCRAYIRADMNANVWRTIEDPQREYDD